jgi:hypothetical protein
MTKLFCGPTAKVTKDDLQGVSVGVRRSCTGILSPSLLRGNDKQFVQAGQAQDKLPTYVQFEGWAST